MVFTIAYYLISLCVNVGTRGFDLDAHRELVASWHPSRYPSLDVFLPVCGEPLAVLHNTWVHVLNSSGPTRVPRPPTSSTTEPTSASGRWPRTSGSAASRAPTAAG